MRCALSEVTGQNAATAISHFKDSVTSIFLSEHDIIDWGAVRDGVAEASHAIVRLEEIRRSLSIADLTRALGEHPKIYDIALSLIAFNTSGSQVSKWGLSASVPSTLAGREHLARQLIHIGLAKVLSGTAPIADLLTIAEVYKDSFRRRFRSGDRFGAEVRRLVKSVVQDTAEQLQLPVSIQPESLADVTLRRSFDFVIAVSGRPIVGIATVFQNQSGGRQQRDLSVTYPILQQKLTEYGMNLVLIADGQGIAEASDRTLIQLFESVRYPMTIKQASDGTLKAAILASVQEPVRETLDSAAVSRLISGALGSRSTIRAEELPLARGPAVLALARYAEGNRDLDLELSSTGETLSWRQAATVGKSRRLTQVFNSQDALDLLAQSLGTPAEPGGAENHVSWVTLLTPDTPPFTGRLFASVHAQGLTQEVRTIVSRHVLELAPGSAFSILLTQRDLAESEVEAHRKRQAVLPVNIVVIGPQLLNKLAQAKDPISVLNKAVLEQSDLTKVSPFILSNATPTRMFFGREQEAATILGTVATNSVALLGSRRIGKTSLLRHVRKELEDANFMPFFGDCQTVRTWSDFAILAEDAWGIRTHEDFRPQHLRDLVLALRAGSDKPVVILLDEIDQLLEWDRTHAENSVPEAFFRACRALSQEGAAQFVFSGERTIATRIWDPQSPHWNFCRPLALAQLTREAVTSLLIRPLKAIGVEIEDEAQFSSEVWRLTSGHPQIAQFLGDRLVRTLDERSRQEDLTLSSADAVAIAESYAYAEHYLDTYWGQANQLERAISLIVSNGPISPGALLSRLKAVDPLLSEGALQGALRMLQLYGIVIEEDGRIDLRATWFNNAQSYFGGPAQTYVRETL